MSLDSQNDLDLYNENKRLAQRIRDLEEQLNSKPLPSNMNKIDLHNALVQIENERRFNLALESAEVGLWDWDITDNSVYFSPVWKKMLGYDEHELEGTFESWNRRIHPADALRVQQAIESYFQDDSKRFEIVYRIRHKNGEWLWFLTRGGTLKDSSGKAYRGIGTNLDITELIHERQKNAELERFFSFTPDLMLITNGEADFLKFNNAWNGILGYAGKDLSKHKFLEFVHPDDIQPTLAAVQTIENEGRITQFVNRYRGAEGSFRDIEWFARLYEGLIYASGRDVTESRKFQAILNSNIEIREKLLQLLALNPASTSEFLDYALKDALLFTHSEMGYIFLYDEDSEKFNLHSWSSEAVLEECRVKEQSGLFHHRQPIIINNYDRYYPLKKEYPQGHVQIRNFMSIPVLYKDKIVAVVGLSNKATDYTDDDVLNLRLLMRTVWPVVERMEAEELLKKKQEALSLNEAKLRMVTENMTDALWVLNVTQGRFTYISPSVEQLLGFTPEEFLTKGLSDIVVQEYMASVSGQIEEVVKDLIINKDSPKVFTNEILEYTKNGDAIWIEYSAKCRFNAHNEIEAVGVSRNIERRKKAEQEILYLSQHDNLTKLFNRHYFEAKIAEEIDRSNRYHVKLSMITLDIDHFKKINDTWGHAVGDYALQQVAELVSSRVRKTDTVARMGGEEFLILLPETTGETAIVVAEKIRQAMEAKVHPGIGRITASFGVAERKVYESYTSWFKRADDALYHSKHRGRNRVTYADDLDDTPNP